MIRSDHECTPITLPAVRHDHRHRGVDITAAYAAFEARHDRYAQFALYMPRFFAGPCVLLIHIVSHRQPARAAAVHRIDVCISIVAHIEMHDACCTTTCNTWLYNCMYTYMCIHTAVSYTHLTLPTNREV